MKQLSYNYLLFLQETIMKEIEDKIESWKASKKQWEAESAYENVLKADFLIKGLKLALDCINEKNNKKLKTDGPKHIFCKTCGTNIGNWACGNCLQ